MTTPLFIPSLEQVAPLVNSQFTLDTDGGPFALTLIRAEEYPRRNLPAQFRTPLSLIFEGPPLPRLTQDTYAFNHPSLAQGNWYIAPVIVTEKGKYPVPTEPGPDAPCHYEVIFA